MVSITSPKLFSVLALIGTATLQAQGFVLNSPHPVITEAPNLHAQMLKRQNDYVTCTEWSYVDGGQPICGPGLTCQYEATGSYGDCLIPSATQAIFTTACLDYPTTWNGVGKEPVHTSFCSAASPLCATVLLEANDGTTYINVGCSTIATTLTAIQIAALPWEISTSTSSSTTPTPSSTASSTSPTTSPPAPSPVTSPATSTASSTTSLSPTPTPAPSSNAAVIGGSVGGIVGGLAIVAGGLLIWYFLRKKLLRQKQEMARREPGLASPIQSPHDSMYKPPFSPTGGWAA